MTVYVDDSKTFIAGAICCHMFADTLDELHAAARKIDLGLFAFTKGEVLAHYNVSMSKRRKAIEQGAVAVNQNWLRNRISEAMAKRRA